MTLLRLLALAALAPTAAWPQGYAGLGTDAEGFAMPAPDPVFDFPADHGPHPEYRIEWWYLTATLTGEDGRDYGIQWTLFRSAMAPEDGAGGGAPQLWLGHAGLTTPEAHYAAERLGRGGIGQAGVEGAGFSAWIDDWAMAGPDMDTLRLTARGADFAYDLDLTATGPLVFHGDGGFSVKSPEGQASYYYSQPFYEVAGTLSLPEGDVAVTGQGWLDREWSSQPLSDSQEGWDWFSLHFADGARMMAFGLRDADGSRFTSATWIAPDGTTTAYGDGEARLTPLREAEVAGRTVPVEWRLELPAQGVDVTTTPLYEGAWMDTSFPYWEGPIYVEGSHAGRGYLEMTGHD